MLADQLLEPLDAAARDTVRRVFGRLLHLGEVEETTRDRLPRDVLDAVALGEDEPVPPLLGATLVGVARGRRGTG